MTAPGPSFLRRAEEPEMPPAWFAAEMLLVAALAVAAVIWGVRPYLAVVVWIWRNWL
jgi:hypothetical protein